MGVGSCFLSLLATGVTVLFPSSPIDFQYSNPITPIKIEAAKLAATYGIQRRRRPYFGAGGFGCAFCAAIACNTSSTKLGSTLRRGNCLSLCAFSCN